MYYVIICYVESMSYANSYVSFYMSLYVLSSVILSLPLYRGLYLYIINIKIKLVLLHNTHLQQLWSLLYNLSKAEQA